MEENSRFRLLEKYVGVYRVKAHYSKAINDYIRNENGEIDETFDELYIPCEIGEIRHSYTPNLMVWLLEYDKITAREIYKELKKFKGKVWYKYENDGEDTIIWFHDNDLKFFAEFFKADTEDNYINPYSKKNLLIER